MVEKLKYNHFFIMGQQEREIDVTAPCLYNDEERAEILNIILLKREAIEEVLVDPITNSVLIRFDSLALPPEALLRLLDVVLANFSEKPRSHIAKLGGKGRERKGLESEIVFFVEGMSCASCALYLEMVLRRDLWVDSASIDFSTKKGVVIGCLKKEEIFAIIEAHGYKAFSEK